MEKTWRMIQVFLPVQPDGIYEVDMEEDSGELRCNCPQFKKKCKHTEFVEDATKSNHGHYKIKVGNIDEDEMEQAYESYDSFRRFVIENAKVEVL